MLDWSGRSKALIEQSSWQATSCQRASPYHSLGHGKKSGADFECKVVRLGAISWNAGHHSVLSQSYLAFLRSLQDRVAVVLEMCTLHADGIAGWLKHWRSRGVSGYCDCPRRLFPPWPQYLPSRNRNSEEVHFKDQEAPEKLVLCKS